MRVNKGPVDPYSKGATLAPTFGSIGGGLGFSDKVKEETAKLQLKQAIPGNEQIARMNSGAKNAPPQSKGVVRI